MREQCMGYLSDHLRTNMHDAAEKAIEMCARGLLSAESVVERMWQDWTVLYSEAESPSQNVVMGLALRVCSYELCQAWKSADSQRCELAYANLLRYLRSCLMRLGYGAQLQEYACAIEDVLNATLEELYREFSRKEQVGPNDPATFLKWTQTIVIRQARLYMKRYQKDHCVSLDDQVELFSENFVDTEKHDPLKLVLLQELRQVLWQSIMEVGNQRYRQVLLYSYLAEIEPQELAQQLQVKVTDIHLWRSRALNALRRKPEVMQILRTLL
jgi:RNA polymerase sigma factor (sigma-70 family)